MRSWFRSGIGEIPSQFRTLRDFFIFLVSLFIFSSFRRPSGNPNRRGRRRQPSHFATVIYTNPVGCLAVCHCPSLCAARARCPLCAPPHMCAASSSVRALPGALMPARCSLCRRVGGACARVRLTLGPLPLSRAGLPCLRTARCPCTSGARARSPSAFHSVRTVRSSRPLPLHTTHVCFVCAVDRTG